MSRIRTQKCELAGRMGLFEGAREEGTRVPLYLCTMCTVQLFASGWPVDDAIAGSSGRGTFIIIDPAIRDLYKYVQ